MEFEEHRKQGGYHQRGRHGLRGGTEEENAVHTLRPETPNRVVANLMLSLERLSSHAGEGGEGTNSTKHLKLWTVKGSWVSIHPT